MNRKEEVSKLIELITPLYNEYKQNRRELSAIESLELMWVIGDILKNFIKEMNIAPHHLYRMVYGKSESSENIAQKSWITREFQGRCYRIRNIFPEKDEIRNDLPSLQAFTLFREAMPFFDNEKYKMQGIERDYLLKLLNSSQDNKSIKKQIDRLKKERIGIKNPRTQRLEELEEEKQLFISFYNFIFDLLEKNPNEIKISLKKSCIEKKDVQFLAQNTNALSQDGLEFKKGSLKSKGKANPWYKYKEMLIKFSKMEDAVVLRRFRRVIPPERIVSLADMLYSLLEKAKL